MGALALAALLGVSGGTVTALVTGSETPPTSDPLRLGIPLENVGCTGDSLLIVGYGENYAALTASAADFEVRGAKYLATADSCGTAYPGSDGGIPTYAVYMPAFDTPKAACEERMQAFHKNDFVTKMNAGNADGVPCACVIDKASLPQIQELGEGEEPTTLLGMWIYLYQQMLDRAGLLDIRDVDTSRFDELTVEATYLLQTDRGLNPTGVVDSETWDVLRSNSCRRFEYS
jgi:Putative peptidoglycan binding domain